MKTWLNINPSVCNTDVDLDSSRLEYWFKNPTQYKIVPLWYIV